MGFVCGMKTIARPIQVISWTDYEGKIVPVRYKILNKDGQELEFKITQIMTVKTLKLAGKNTRIYTGMTLVNGQERYCEIRYETESCRWMMFKV